MIKVDPPMERKDLSRNLVINIVDEADGQATIGSVAEQLSVDPSAASRVVSELISRGFVERLASQRDGRRTVLRLTPDGVALRTRPTPTIVRSAVAAWRRHPTALCVGDGNARLDLGARSETSPGAVLG